MVISSTTHSTQLFTKIQTSIICNKSQSYDVHIYNDAKVWHAGKSNVPNSAFNL